MSAPAVASAALKARVRRPSLYNKVVHPEELIKLFPNGSYIGWSGFTGVGYPKCVMPELPPILRACFLLERKGAIDARC